MGFAFSREVRCEIFHLSGSEVWDLPSFWRLDVKFAFSREVKCGIYFLSEGEMWDFPAFGR